MAAFRSRQSGVNVAPSMSTTILRRTAQSGRSAGTGLARPAAMVASKLFHQVSALLRIDSNTIALGFAAASSRQKAHAGQSTVAS